MKSKTPTLGGGPTEPQKRATPPAIPQAPERRVTPPPFRAQTPPPFRAQTPPPTGPKTPGAFPAQTLPPFKAQEPSRQPLDSQRFESEPPTKQKNMTASIYQSLLSVFDEMSDDQRMEFVDLASVYASLTAGARKDLVDMLGEYAKLGPEERQGVFEAVKNLQTARSRR